MVAGFASSQPNETLMAYARHVWQDGGGNVALDLGCGAARNALPLALDGWRVVGTDRSRPMLDAARERVRPTPAATRALFVEAPMDALPVASACADLIVAHGIWNLARSAREFRDAVREAARAARPNAALFVFTFSRHTLPPGVRPVEGETFVFTQFSGERQCFLTRGELLAELDAAGFTPDPAVPLTELNRRSGLVPASGPVIYQAAFRFTA